MVSTLLCQGNRCLQVRKGQIRLMWKEQEADLLALDPRKEMQAQDPRQVLAGGYELLSDPVHHPTRLDRCESTTVFRLPRLRSVRLTLTSNLGGRLSHKS